MESPYLTTKEAAAYLRFESTSAIRNRVMRGELVPAGAGPYGTHMFLREELDRFVRDRAAPRALGEKPRSPAPSPVARTRPPGPVHRRSRRDGQDRHGSRSEFGLRALVDKIYREREEAEKNRRPLPRKRSRHDPEE